MGYDAVDGINLSSGLETVSSYLELVSGSSKLIYDDASLTANSSVILANDSALISHTSGTSTHTFTLATDGIALLYSDGTYTNNLSLSGNYIYVNDLKIKSDLSQSITGTGGLDVSFELPTSETIYNALVMVTIICTGAGNGVGLTTGEAFVG